MRYINNGFFIFIYLLIFLMTLICQSCRSTSTSNSFHDLVDRSVLSSEGVTVKAFDINGNIIDNPSKYFSLSISKSTGSREVVVSLKGSIVTNSSFIELRYNANLEHYTEIQCGTALLKYNPLVYLGSPDNGLIISAQMLLNQPQQSCSGDLLKVKLTTGKQTERTLSSFKQDPTTDPILVDASADTTDTNKIFWTYKLRGDGNQNQVFDFADFGSVGLYYNKMPKTTTNCEPADADGKGKVDFADFGTIGADYNRGIGGVKIWRDDNASPITLLGVLSSNSSLKGDFTVDKDANKTLDNGFKQYWHTISGAGRYIKLALLDKTGTEVTGHTQIIDTKGGSTSGRGDWWMYGRETTHNRRSPITGPKLPIVSWKFAATESVGSSAAIGSDGTIYFGADDNSFYALNPTGSLKWKYAVGVPADAIVWSSPAIAEDGTIYFGAGDHNVYALKPDGTLLWKYTTGAFVFGSPTIDTDGTIYIASEDKYLYALNPNGSLKWKYDTVGEKIFSSPAIGSDGTIYIGATDNNLIALKNDGTLKWKYLSGGPIYSSPSIGADGNIYFGCWDNNLYSIKPDGTLNWKYETKMMIRSSTAIAADGSIYIGSFDGYLYSISNSGTEQWKFNTNAMIMNNCPLIDANGTIYIGSADNNLYIINPDGTQKYKLPLGVSGEAGFDSSPTIGADGKIYIGSSNKNLYAIGSQDAQADMYPPTNVAASDATSTFKITLTWTPPVKGDAPTGYKIYRSKTETGTYSIIAEVGDVTTYNDSTITDTKTYWYKVSSIKGMDESDLSTADSGSKKEGAAIGRGDWWMLGRDPTHSFSSPYGGPSDNTKKWSTETQGTFSQSSVLLSDGTIIVGSNGTTSDYYLFAFNPDGTEKWKYSFTKSVLSSPAIGQDGTIYVGCQDENLHAINPDGTPKWKFTTDPANSDSVYGAVNSSPSIASDGTIYVGCNDSKLYAINPDGSKKWVFDVPIGTQKYPNRVDVSPAISSTNRIYFGTTNLTGVSSGHKFYAVGADGKEIWSIDCGAVDSSPTIATDGTIYFGCEDFKIYALSPDGKVKWTLPTDDGFYVKPSPVIGLDGTVYCGTQNKKFYAINPSDGSLKWTLETDNQFMKSAIIDKSGIIYIPNGVYLIALNPDKTEKWKYTNPNASKAFTTPIIAPDGTLYVGSGDKFFYAFGPK